MKSKSGMLRHPLVMCMLAGAVALLIAACGGSSSSSSSSSSGSSGNSGSSSTSSSSSSSGSSTAGIYGSLPATGGTPTNGGTITFGQLTGATPTYIMPIIPAADASVYTAYDFINIMDLPLLNGPVGDVPKINYPESVASGPPTYSNGDKTVTVKLKTGYKWSNGAPVDANDIEFYVDETEAAVKESPANYENYAPGLFPENVKSMTEPNKYTIVFHLTKAYNPGYYTNDQLNLIYPMPSTDWNVDASGKHLNFKVPANAKKIYDYLNKNASKVAGFSSFALWKDADGPYKLKSFNATNGSWTMTANSSYGGSDKPHITTVQGETFTGITPTLNALRTGSIDIATLDASVLGEVSSLRSQGVSVFGYPDLSWTGAFINFKDATDHFGDVAKQLYFRQAMMHLEQQPAYVSGILKNAGGPDYGSVPAVPATPYTPKSSTTGDYPFSTTDAANLLKANGWKVVPNGTDTCIKPGTAKGDCGAGIPKGTPLKFTWAYLSPQTQQFQSLESEAFASQAKKVGIDVQLQSKAFNFLVQNYNDASPAASKYTNDWGVSYFGGYTDDYYPTTSTIFNTTGSYNQGAYSDPEANKLINASVYGKNANAVTAEANYLTKDVPVLFMPNPDLIEAVSNKVGSASTAPFLSLTQYQPFFQDYWIKK